jgi:ribonucleoside-diphosphate reductase alpha chain
MLPSQYQQFIHLSRYSRWDSEENRRETWEETVDRYFDFFIPYLNENHGANLARTYNDYGDTDELRNAVLNLEALPSMRCLMTAGPALGRDHIAGYNCAYRPIDDISAFDEIMFILMCGTGVGFSVERQYVNQLPVVPDQLSDSSVVLVVRDSKRGWAEGFRELLGLLYAGRIPAWDTSNVRDAGEVLSTMGGRASGPGPLEEVFKFTVQLFKNAVGRKLNSLECHDLVCKIGECIVVGGVRRPALISLSNLSDNRMRDAKSGEWWNLEPQRALANNSVAYTEKPDVGQFMEEWNALYASKSGERGIFNREAARAQAASSGRRKIAWDNEELIDFGTNPCSEIVLRPQEFCNLSTIVVRPEDTRETLAEKARIATILGTWQSCLTDFRYIGRKWGVNCKEERLLGVSMTGIMSNDMLTGKGPGGLEATAEVLDYLREEIVIPTNKEWADRLHIPQSAAITCVKPEGTASQLVCAPSGIHADYSEYYIRRVRQDRKDPLTQLMIDQGLPHEQDVMNPEAMVFSFPMKSAEGAVLKDDLTALEQLEHWKVFQDHWCEHKPSITVTTRENEWPEVGAWVWNNFDAMSGVSFLPHSDHVYKQAPFEEIDELEYHRLLAEMPVVDWSVLGEYENTDTTTGTRELACVAGLCEI